MSDEIEHNKPGNKDQDEILDGGTVEESNDEVIEGGHIAQLPSVNVFDPKRHQFETARILAIALVVIMGFSVTVHYCLIAVFTYHGKEAAAEALNKIFNSWLPVISGLVGSAVTFFFTREK